MRHYYAIFKQNDEVIEVAFPDLEGCVTYGRDWEEALVNAEDVLAAWLAHAEKKFIKSPSTHAQLVHLTVDSELVPIHVDAKLLASYQELKRFNVILPIAILRRIDNFRRKAGLKRSTFLQKAAEEYLRNHEVAA
jgi:predicted RNase H-like HicB family nuclease